MPSEREEYARSLNDWQRREAEGELEPTPEPPAPVLSASEQFVLDQRQQMLEQRRPWWKLTLGPEYGVVVKKRQREFVLARIGNARLRELVEAAYNATRGKGNGEVRWLRESKDYLPDAQGGDSLDALAYRHWVRERLRQSDLATLLPGGRESLPDIYEALREPWSSLERLGEPKNYRQLIRHVVRHLDWYLDPVQAPKPPIWQLSAALSFIICAALFVGFQFLEFNFQPNIWIWFMIGSGLAIGISKVLARLFAPHHAGDQRLHGFYRVRELINSAELFYYLVESYMETDEPAPDS